MDFDESQINSLFTVIRPDGSKSVTSPSDSIAPLMAGDAVIHHDTDYLNYVPTEKTEEGI